MASVILLKGLIMGSVRPTELQRQIDLACDIAATAGAISDKELKSLVRRALNKKKQKGKRKR